MPSFSVCVWGGGQVKQTVAPADLGGWACAVGTQHGSAAHLGMEVPHTWAWKYHTPGQGSAAHLGTEVLHTWAWECCTSGMEQGDYANQFPLKGDLGRTLNKSPKAVQGFNTAY